MSEIGYAIDLSKNKIEGSQSTPSGITPYANLILKPEVIQKLDRIGIKQTRQLFPHVLSGEDRRAFAEENQIADDDLMELTRLTDIARLKWVGPKFARLLIESSYDSVEKIANSDYEALYLALVQVNEEKEIYKGNIGKEDLKNWVNVVVQDVPQVIQY